MGLWFGCVEVSAKVKLVNASARVTNSMSFYVDSNKRLNIFNDLIIY